MAHAYTTTPLIRQQIDAKLRLLRPLSNNPTPRGGWIRVMRSALGLTLEQLAHRMGISRQSVHSLEQREKEGGISLRALREAAAAMDMQLVYALVPVDGSIEALIDRRARELAREIVLRTSTTMALEDQKNTNERLEHAIEERAEQLKADAPWILWKT